MAKPRNVVKEPTFEEAAKKVEPDLKRFDEAIAALEYVLARLPESGTRTSPSSRVWFYEVDNDPGMAPAWVYYTFTNTHVYFLFIELVSHGNGD